MSLHEKNNGRYDYPTRERPDFGAKTVPQPVDALIKKYRRDLVGEIVGTRSGTYYVIRGISYLAGKTNTEVLRATQLGDITKTRPPVVFIRGNASVILYNTLKESALITNGIEYRKILKEIYKEGESVEIPPEKKGEFDIF